MIQPTKFLIDGIDRLGKSSLIKRIQDELGYHLVIHYDKPQVLMSYRYETTDDNSARQVYQQQANLQMFSLMTTKVPIIFDRTHLGEMVYAPLYRKYSGEYVYNLEKQFVDDHKFTEMMNVRLILLTSSNTEMLQDDGLSFDPTKKNEEQDLFINAFHQSNLTNKVIVDVHDGNDGYKSFEQVYLEAIYKPAEKL